MHNRLILPLLCAASVAFAAAPFSHDGKAIATTKHNGEEKSWDTLGGTRDPGLSDYRKLMSDEDITNKFNRASAYMQIPDAERDRARSAWGNLHAVKDIDEAIQTLAKFGKPSPL